MGTIRAKFTHALIKIDYLGSDIIMIYRWRTQESLCGGLAHHSVPVNLRQAGDQGSGLSALTEAAQDATLDQSVRLVSFTTTNAILRLR